MDAHDQNTMTRKRYNSGPLREQLLAGTMEQWNNGRIEMHQSQPAYLSVLQGEIHSTKNFKNL